MNAITRTALIFSTALLIISPTHAQVNPALTSAIGHAEKLLNAEAQNFKGLSAQDIRTLRKNISADLTAAKNHAKARYAKMSAGKTKAQIDQELWAIADHAKTPDAVRSMIKAAGGPAQVMQQMDHHVDGFKEDLLMGSKQFSLAPLDRLLDALIPSAHARLWSRIKSGVCSVSMFTLTWGEGTDANYKMCNI